MDKMGCQEASEVWSAGVQSTEQTMIMPQLIIPPFSVKLMAVIEASGTVGSNQGVPSWLGAPILDSVVPQYTLL